MRILEKILHIIQILAAVCLGVAFFLPLYETYGLLGGINYGHNAILLFFWAVPAAILLAVLPIRWLKVALCVFSSLLGLVDIGMLRFLAFFKASPLSGFFLAQTSLILLIACWLALGIVTLIPKKASAPVHAANP